MKHYINSHELGSVYRLTIDGLEYAPLMKDGTFDSDEFGLVEPDLIGEETVVFNGVETDFYHVFDAIKEILEN